MNHHKPQNSRSGYLCTCPACSAHKPPVRDRFTLDMFAGPVFQADEEERRPEDLKRATVTVQLDLL